MQVQNLARVRAGQKRMGQALDLAEDKTMVRRNASVTYHNQGIYFYNQKEFDAALFYFKESLNLNGDYFSAAYHIGQVYWILGQYIDAVDAYQKAIQIEPKYVDPYLNIAKIFLENKRYDAVRNMIEVVLEFAPGEAEAYDLLGIAYQAQGDLTAAEKAFQKTLVLDPNMIASHLGLAELYKKTKPEAARQHLLIVLDIDAENEYAQKGLQQLSP